MSLESGYDSPLASGGRVVDRREALCVPRGHVDAVELQQRVDGLAVAAEGRQMQRRVAVSPPGVEVDLPAAGERLHRAGPSAPRSGYQRGGLRFRQTELRVHCPTIDV